MPEELRNLQGDALRFAVEQPLLWEHRLFSRILRDEMDHVKDRRLDLKYGIALGPGDFIDDYRHLIKWARAKISESLRMTGVATELVNVALNDGLGEPGQPGDPERLVYVAKRIAKVYEQVMEWSLETKRVGVADDEFKELVTILGGFLDDALNDIETWSLSLWTFFEDLASSIEKNGPPTEPKTFEFNLVFSVKGAKDLSSEMDRLSQMYGI